MTSNTDVKLSIEPEEVVKLVEVLSSKTKILGRVGTYELHAANLYGYDRSPFVSCVYDLQEIARAYDVESYIVQSVRKHREQVLKEGYAIKGTEDEMVAYIKNRLFEIALVTGITTEQVVREVVFNLIMYHNAYIVLRRDSKRSSGKPIVMYGKTLKPIAGLFVPDPTTMETTVDKYGTVKKWRQKMNSLLENSNSNDGREFAVEDVIHITVDKRSGYTFGTPYILSVLDDIRALRRLEELVVVLASKEAFPIYHYKVGTPDKPATIYDDGTTEVDNLIGQIASLPQQGFVVTSERVEVSVVSKSGASLDIKPYIDYFEDRVLAGLRVSSIDIGRGSTSNRGSATTMSKNMQDAAKDYQQVISDCLTFKLILPLLLEGGYDVTIENLVCFDFPPIDREELRAQQTHGLNMYNASAISREEFRKDYLNKKMMTDEEKKDTLLQFNLEASLAELGVKAAAAAKSSSVVGKKTKSSRALVANIAQPRNQHKVSATKPRVPANDYIEAINEGIAGLKTGIVQNDSSSDVKAYIQSSIQEIINSCTELTIVPISEKIREGWDFVRKEFENKNKNAESDVDYIGSRAIDRFFKNFVNKSYWKAIDSYLEAIYSCLEGDKNDFRYIKYLEDVRTTLKNLIPIQLDTAFRFGYVSYAKRIGYKSVEILDRDGTLQSTIDLSSQIIYTSLIPKDDENKLRLPSKTLNNNKTEENE